MDITAKTWELGKSYKQDDIVRLNDLSIPDYVDIPSATYEGEVDIYAGIGGARFNLVEDDGAFIITNQQEKIIVDYAKPGNVQEEVILDKNDELDYGFVFNVDSSISYSISGMIKKGDDNSDLIDSFTTSFLTENGKIDEENSVGAGVGIRFFNNSFQEIRPVDLRKTARAMAASELSYTEWYNVKLDIPAEDIPTDARYGIAFVFLYGHSSGSFIYRNIEAGLASKFFYCTEDHKSSILELPGGSEYWTQDFKWRPSYNSKVSFSSINQTLKLGDGGDYTTNHDINSLPIELNLTFNNRTDKQAKAIIHFLQEKHFPYDSIFSLNFDGNKLLSKEVGNFNFEYTYPYRKDLKFTCTSFSHNIAYRNNNNISATFVCNTESTLRSVEGHQGYNDRTDVLLPIYIDTETEFKRGESITLNTFSLKEDPQAEEGEEEESRSSGVEILETASRIQSTENQSAIITFDEEHGLKVLDCVNIQAPEDSIYNIEVEKISNVLNAYQVEVPLTLTEGSDQALINIGESVTFVVKRLIRCPQDCLTTRPIFPDSVSSVAPELVDPVTGEKRKRILFLKNYRRVMLESEITRETSSVTVTPLENFTVKDDEDFKLIIPCVTGRSSIYLQDPDRVAKYPWLKVRSFEHKPSFSFSINQAPEHLSTNFLESYVKKYKNTINQNLFSINLVFDLRSDEEAVEILQFLESHLGYKKFRFDLPRPYFKDIDYLTTPNRDINSIFYCPAWEHTVVYKNNHTITATFVESATSYTEDLRDVYGLYGREEQEPCFAAELNNPVTEHHLCTFSSSLQVAEGIGVTIDDLNNKIIATKNKAVDLIFIIDTTGSMTHYSLSSNGVSKTKYEAAVDIILKIITSYDDNKMPGTESYNGIFDAPEISFDNISGDSNEPPWPVDSSQTSLIDVNAEDIKQNLQEKGYNTQNLERFKIKVDQKRVNIGFILMGNSTADDPNIVIDCSDIPEAFDKKVLFDIINNKKDAKQVTQNDFENSPRALSLALSQMYNSPRAEYVTDRIIVMLSDGVFTTEDAYLSYNGPGEGFDAYSLSSLELCSQIRKGGDLAKRRPLDNVLSKYGYKSHTPFHKLQNYKNKVKDGKSKLINPDLGENNPSWYDDSMPTVLIFAGIGAATSGVTKYAKNYVYDYDRGAPYLDPPQKDLQFYFPITDSSVEGGEINRLIDLIEAINILTNDHGSQNLFSCTVHNCGPFEVEILNTLVNVKSQESAMKWTTELLKQGIPKGGDSKDIQSIDKINHIDNIKRGYGGQYYGDTNNQKLLTKEYDNSNIAWESFNTEYEVYREGKVHEINGGWNREIVKYKIVTDDGFQIQLQGGELLATDDQGLGEIKTEGVKNTGVAFKNMPIRVFKGDSSLEIIDYNIGNIKEENNFKGDYSHLPKLKPGESLDLFFGIRAGRLSDISEEIQLVIHTDDGTIQKTDCYGNINFSISIPKLNDNKPTQSV